jgi:hypothetical protein
MAEEGDAGGHPHEHLTEVDKDGHLEDGVGREVLKMEPELLQQQQEERRDRQRRPAGDEQHELPGGEIAEGSGAGADPSGVHRRAPSKQVAHQVERPLKLETLGMAKRSHSVGGGASVEQKSANAKGHKELEGERAQRLGENAKV